MLPLSKITLLLILYAYLASAYGLAKRLQLHAVAGDVSIPEKVCQITAKYGAQVSFLYSSSQQWNNATNQLEINLHKCLASGMPIYTLDIERFIIEPQRKTDSFNIFVIPDAKAQALARVRSIVALLNAKQTYKHFHRYIFIWRTATDEELHGLFALIWSKSILDAIVVMHARVICTFEPFTAHGFLVKRITDERFFYDKLQNWHRYQLRISMFKELLRAKPKPKPAEGFTAVDGLLASTIANKLNATALYIPPDDNNNYGLCRNGSFTGALKHVISGKSHVNFNTRFIIDCIVDHIEQLYPYHKRTLYLVVPAAEELPKYLIFVNAFATSVWRLMLLNFCLVVAFFYVLKRCLDCIPRTPKLKHGCWYDIIELVNKTQLGEPIDGFVRISSLRQFLISWIFFSYVLTTIYFAKLESSFVHPVFEPELNELDDMPTLKVPIFALSNVLDVVKVSLEPKHLKYIIANTRRLPQSLVSETYTLNIAKRLSYRCAFITSEENAREFLLSTYNLEENRPSFHVVKQYLRTMPRTYIVTRGSPFLFKFQRMVNSLFEGGILEHWIDADVRHRNLDRNRNLYTVLDSTDSGADDLDFVESDQNDSETEIKKVALSMEILQGAFYLWGFGILLSMLGFGAEYAHWLYQKGKLTLELY